MEPFADLSNFWKTLGALPEDPEELRQRISEEAEYIDNLASQMNQATQLRNRLERQLREIQAKEAVHD